MEVTSSGVPTGPVNFISSGGLIGYAYLNGGAATLTKSNLNAQELAISAVYKGDANNFGSTSAVVDQIVNQVGHEGADDFRPGRGCNDGVRIDAWGRRSDLHLIGVVE